MATTLELAKPAMRRGQAGLIPLAFGVPSLIRGVDRIGDGHPLSGWLMLAGGLAMVGGAAWFWLRRSRA
jgi:LPXTG-motif cell wall-anchored protein